MRKVTIRKFNREFYQEIKSLPIVVTKNNKKFLVVTSYQEVKASNVVTSKKPSVVTKEKVVTREPTKHSGLCKHGAMKGLCKNGC